MGGVRLEGPVVEEVVRLSAQVVVFGVQLAGPVLVVTVLADVALAIISRAAPQVNILIVGMPLKTFAGFFFMSISFYFLPHMLGQSFMSLHKGLFAVLQRLG